MECGNHRTIILASHASEIILRLLTRIMNTKSKNVIVRNQFGFRKICGTCKVIVVMRMLYERGIELGY